jgi:MoaA/NifB/PqqE/SkfB family radical SAM enzyme
VGVSIDDPDPEVHDRLRGVPGAFAKAVEGLRLLRELRIPCQIQTYAARRLIPEGLRRIIELGRQIGVFAVYFFFPIAAGRWNEAFDEVLTEAERSQVRALQDWSFVHMELPTPGSLCCVFTRNVLYVSPQGEVTPCPFVPYILGNVREHSLAELWRVHGAGLSFQYRGECPLNAPEPREALRRHVDAVARAVSAAERAE